MRPVTVNPQNPIDALTEIQTASHENDIVELAQNFVGSNFPAIFVPGSAQTFQQGNAANTSELTLANYSLPANSLTTINQGLRISAAGYWGTNGTEAKIRLYFGTQAFVIDQKITDGSTWYAEMTVIYAQAGSPAMEFVTGFALTNSFNSAPLAANPSIDITSAITIKVTGQSPSAGVANEANAYQLLVEPLGTDMANVLNTFSEFLVACSKGGINRTT